MGFVGLMLSCHRVFVGILWVLKFFSWLFHGFKIFSGGYSVGLFFILVANSVIQRFSIVRCMRQSDRKQQYINTFRTAHSIPDRFQQLPALFILEMYLIY